MLDRTALRALRVTVFAAVCLVLGAYGHRLDSGHHPTVPPLLFGAGLVLFAASRLAGRERSLAGIAAAVVAIQAGLHIAFVFGDSAHLAGGAGHAGDLGTGVPPGALPPLPVPEPRLGLTAGMALAHLVAALVAAWWLRAGEAAVWSLCHRAGTRAGAPLRRVQALLAAPTLPLRPALAPVPPRHVPLRSRVLRHAVHRRGPPCSAASFPPPAGRTPADLAHPGALRVTPGANPAVLAYPA